MGMMRDHEIVSDVVALVMAGLIILWFFVIVACVYFAPVVVVMVAIGQVMGWSPEVLGRMVVSGVVVQGIVTLMIALWVRR